MKGCYEKSIKNDQRLSLTNFLFTFFISMFSTDIFPKYKILLWISASICALIAIIATTHYYARDNEHKLREEEKERTRTTTLKIETPDYIEKALGYDKRRK